MKAFRKGKRLLAVALSVLLAVNGLPSVAFAEGQTAQGLCEHHPSHTADCGYAQAQPCEHEHTADCYCYTDEPICGFDEAEETTASGSNAVHTHIQECYKLDCPHEQHDDACGYTEGSPCGYDCQETHGDLAVSEPVDNSLSKHVPVLLGSRQSEYEIQISGGDIEFTTGDGGYDEGYTVGGDPGDNVVQPWNVDVYSYGSKHDASLIVSLEGVNAGQYFALSTTTLNWTDLGNGNGSYDAFTVEPKPGLSAGTYEATLKVTGDNAAVSVGLKFIVQSEAPGFVAVTNIKDVSTDMTAGTSLTLTGTVEPDTATNKTITWSLENAGNTGASLSNGLLSASSAGTVKVKATVENGATATTPYEQTFTITVNPASPGFVAVTNIKDVSTDMTAGTSLTLTGTVEPSNATNKTIAWSLENAGDTNASLNNGVLSATSAGQVTVKATVENGATASTPYEQTFTITVNPASPGFVAVTNVKDVPTDMTAGTSLTLTGTVEPSNATNKTITWSLENAGNTGASLSNGLLSASSAGTVKVKATVANGATATTPYEQTFTITVNPASPGFVAVTNIKDVPTDMTVGTSLTLTGTVEPSNATNKTITWSLHSNLDTTDATLNKGVLTATSAGWVRVTATIADGEAVGTPYEKIFFIAVNPAGFVAVKGITGVPTDMVAGTSLTLTGTVEPSNATNKTIIWSLRYAGDTGATLNNGVLSATSYGTVQVMATVEKGTAFGDGKYLQFFNINVTKRISGGDGTSGGYSPKIDLSDISLKLSQLEKELEQGESYKEETPDGIFTVDKKVPANVPTFDENGNLIVKVITVMPDGSGWVSAAPTEERPSQEAIDALFGKKVNMDLIGTADFQVYDVNENSPNVIIKLEPEDGQADRETLTQSVQDLMQEAKDLGLNLGFDPDKLNDPNTSAEDLQKMRKTLQSMIALAEAESVAGDKNTDITISFDEGEVDIEKEIEFDLEAYIQFQEASGIKNEPGGTGERPAMLLMENGVITPTSIVSVLNKEDGEWKERPAFAGNGFVIFATSHFSPFALVADPSTLAIPDQPNPCSFQPKNARVQDGVLRVEITASAARTATGLAGALAAYSGTEFAAAAVTIDLTGQTDAWDGCALTLARDALNNLKAAGTRRLDLTAEQFSLSLDGAALDALYAAKDSVTLRVDRAADLSETALSALGNRPAYRLSAENGGKAVSLFEKGDVTLSLPYDTQGSEQGGSLALAFVNAQGAVSTLPASAYNAERKTVTGRADRAGVFGVAALPAPAFGDVGGHWAGDDIAFAASRGYLNGTGGSRFSPDGAMIRGMLVTVLHRLAGNPQAAGEGGAFSDVPADAYCADAARWAAEAGILNKEADAFSPEKPVTRQELAVLLQSYAWVMQIDLPKTHEVTAFADGGAIAPWARDAVRELQMAGILSGKQENRFDPTGTVTRAEFSTVLRRFTEAAITH